MIVPITVTDALVVVAFFFFSLSFITLGLVGLGKGKPEGAGTVFIFVGIIEAILGFIIVYANLDSPVFISVGLLVLIFAFTWLAAGIVNLRGYDLVPLGNACILSGLMMLPFAAFFVINSELFSTIGWVWLTVNVLSWAWVFWSVMASRIREDYVPSCGLDIPHPSILYSIDTRRPVANRSIFSSPLKQG